SRDHRYRAASPFPAPGGFELAEEVLHRREALPGVGAQPAREDAADAPGAPRASNALVEAPVDDVVAELEQGGALEGQNVVDRLVESGAEAEDVRLKGGGLAPHLLGRHIGRRAHQFPRLREAPARDIRLRNIALECALRESEVGDPYFSIVPDEH